MEMTQACGRAAIAKAELQSDLTPRTYAQNDVSLAFLEHPVGSSPKRIHSEPDAADCNDFLGSSVQSYLPPRICSPPPPPVLLPSGLNIPPPPGYIKGDVQGLATASQRNAFVDRLEREQEDLRDIRDNILGFRFRLRAQRSKLRIARMAASAKDGSLLNMLRQYLHEHELPEHIRTELEEASDLRDRLGPMESTYDELEREYDTQEWNYTRRETNFIQNLTDNNFVVVETPHQKTDTLESAKLTSFAMSGLECLEREPLREELHIGDTRDPLDAPDNPDYSPPIDEFEDPGCQASMSSCGGVVQDLIQGNESYNLHKRRLWARKILEIDDWLQDQVSKSPILKLHAEICREKVSLDGHSWWEQVKQNWISKQDGLPAFHTGDSTISDLVISSCTSRKAEVLNPVREHARRNSTDQMTKQDSAPDLQNPLDPGTNWKLARHVSLAEEDDKAAQAILTTQPATVSITTDESPSRRSSSSLDQVTDTTSHGSWTRGDYVVQSIGQATFNRRLDVSSLHHSQDSEHNSQSAPATPTQHRKDRRNSATSPSRSISINLGTDEETVCNAYAPLTGTPGPSGPSSNLPTAKHDSLSSLIVPRKLKLEPSEVVFSPSPAPTLSLIPGLPEGVPSQVAQHQMHNQQSSTGPHSLPYTI